MKTWAIAGLLVGFGFCLCSADAQEADAESKITALERVAKIQACEAKDLKTLDAMLDDSFAFVDAEGRLRNKAEVLALIQTASPMKFGVDTMVVRLHGDTAIVTGFYLVKRLQPGDPFVRQGRFVDTWLYKNGHWVAIASLLTPMND